MFKRGFLNSDKGRQTISVEEKDKQKKALIEQVQQSEPDPIKVEKTEDGKTIYHYDPAKGPPDVHMPPAHVLKDLPPGKTRVVFRHWPRDPKGEVMRKDRTDSKDWKMTPNGYQLWASTLYDFFRTEPLPGMEGYSMISTSSKLASWMRAHNETYAGPELKWAEEEKMPYQVMPCDVGRLIWDRERDMQRRTGWLVKGRPQPTLQVRIPYNLLPEKLIVHDPSNALSVGSVRYKASRNEDEAGKEGEGTQNEKPDVTHVYRLHLSEAGKRKREEDLEEARKEAALDISEPGWVIFGPGLLDLVGGEKREDPKTKSPPFAVYIKRPPLPPPPSSVEEAHVYIRAEDLCGAGNHSVVYTVDWELPRWVLCGREDAHCEECIARDASVEIARRREAGTLFDKPAEIPPPPEGLPPDYPSVYIEDLPVRAQNIAGRDSPCEHLKEQADADFGGEAPKTARVRVCAKLSRQNDDHLPHEAANYQQFPDWFFQHWSGYNVVKPLLDPTPCGALVPNFYGYYVPESPEAPSVPGYSSTAEDPKLPYSPEPAVDNANDALNSSEDAHSSGDNAYTHADDSADDSSGDDSPITTIPTRAIPSRSPPPEYLSPILLLEYCGVPIEPEKLSIDDKQEAAALFLLLSSAGWVQNSIAARNVLVQAGPLSDWPLMRITNVPPKSSFRLIDFGRARKVEEYPVAQETQAMELFELGIFNKGPHY